MENSKNSITLLTKVGITNELAYGNISELLPASFIYLQSVRDDKAAVSIPGKKLFIEVRASATATINSTLNAYPLAFRQVFGATHLYVADVEERFLHMLNIVQANIKLDEPFYENRIWIFGHDFLKEFGTDKDSVRNSINLIFDESNLKEAEFEKPTDATGDYSLTGKLIALADAGIITKEHCITYRDLFEKLNTKI